jgi:hypothetical protein
MPYSIKPAHFRPAEDWPVTELRAPSDDINEYFEAVAVSVIEAVSSGLYPRKQQVCVHGVETDCNIRHG